MLSQQLRKKFLHYFETKKHQVLPSAPVVPFEDPTLLFLNAGMNPFKDFFLGEKAPTYPRIATSQKCIRVGGKHNDLENVGHTTRHLTFFEMLGNFSFGDYFKKEAIQFAWEVSTQVFALPSEKIWISVFEEDEEAFELWKKWVPEKKIVRLGEKDNFWSMGEMGPCGPCSELLFDKGPSYSSAGHPKEDITGERFFEFWNLVFMQNQKLPKGKVVSLPKKNIDTGMGLERIVSLKMGVDNVFETDVLGHLVKAFEQIAKVKCTKENQSAFFVIADHIRSLCFAMADGAIPSNTDRGYVLRKILRRAVRYGRQLNLQDPFLAELVPTLLQLMGEDYPELCLNQLKIEEILTQEEEAFFRTLRRGGNILQSIVETSQKKGILQGEDAFKLKDTYGLPLEEIQLIAHDYALKVDLTKFQELEKEAKERSKKAQAKNQTISLQNLDFSQVPPSTFVGYTHYESSAKIVAILQEDQWVQKLQENEEGILFLDQTPFYAEMGGQVGDKGRLCLSSHLFTVIDTKNFAGEHIGHLGKMEKGSLQVGQKINAQIDRTRRTNLQNNHTATHLLHWALQKVLGDHIRQAGSLVEEERFRFDFSHHKALSLAELHKIEKLIQEKICENTPVQTYTLPYTEVQKKQEIKQFFGDKYGEQVRIVDLHYSKELCGGTHTLSTGTLGTFKILKESSIAAGTRRVEAVTGIKALGFFQEKELLVETLAKKLQVPSSKLEDKIDLLLEENTELQKEAKKQITLLRKQSLESLKQKTLSLETFSLLCQEVDFPPSELMPLSEELSQEISPCVIILGSQKDGSCLIVIRVSSELNQINAKELIQKVAPLIQGGGGGKKTFAQAGGKNPENLSAALQQLKKEIEALPIKK